MIRKLRSVFAALLVLALVAGCGSATTPSKQEPAKPSANEQKPASSQPTTPAKPSSPVKGGVLTVSLNSNPAMWPVSGGLPNILSNKAMFNNLTQYDAKTGAPAPDLAESWSVSSDGLTWTFKLRKNVKWHDGKPFTADDVVFTVNDVWMKKEIGWYLSGNFSTLTKAEKVDDHTVNLITKSPTGNLPTMLGYLAVILPKHVLGSWTVDNFKKPEAFTKNPIGTGPFKFKEFVPGSHLRVEKFAEYFEGEPYLDAVVFKVMGDVEQQLAQLQSGQLDWMPIEPYQLNTLKGKKDIDIVEARQVNYFYVGFHNKIEPFNDPKVRQAMNYATDVKAIISNTLDGKGEPSNGPIAPWMGNFHNKNAMFYNYDVKKAEALLDEAGWKQGAGGIRAKDGKKLEITLEVDAGNPVREQTAVIVQELWKKVGADVKIKTSDFNPLLARIRAGAKADVQAWIMWYITPPDPDITAYYGTGQSTNTFHYSNPEVDKLLKEGQQATDPAKRKVAYDKMQELIAKDAPVVWLYFPYELQAKSAKVQDWPSGVGYRDAFTYLEKIWKQQ